MASLGLFFVRAREIKMGLEQGADNSSRLVKSEGLLTLIEFRASWCAVCKQQSLIVEQIARELSLSLEVRQIDIEENAAIAIEMGVQSVPTLILYKRGEESLRFIGLKGRDTICSILKKHLESEEKRKL